MGSDVGFGSPKAGRRFLCSAFCACSWRREQQLDFQLHAKTPYFDSPTNPLRVLVVDDDIEVRRRLRRAPGLARPLRGPGRRTRAPPDSRFLRRSPGSRTSSSSIPVCPPWTATRWPSGCAPVGPEKVRICRAYRVRTAGRPRSQPARPAAEHPPGETGQVERYPPGARRAELNRPVAAGFSAGEGGDQADGVPRRGHHAQLQPPLLLPRGGQRGQLAAAAARLGVTQPTVSEQIRALERAWTSRCSSGRRPGCA